MDKFEDYLIDIKLLINKHYEDIGRFGEVTNMQMTELIDKIDNILNSCRLDKKKMILKKLEEEQDGQ